MRLKRFIIYDAAIMALVLGFSSCTTHHTTKQPMQAHHTVKSHKHVKHIPPTAERILTEARSWLGTPYAYAKADKGFGTDCSGLVMTVIETATGVKIPRNSAKQAEFCIPLSDEDVRPGDLVFFATGRDPEKVSHVGIMMEDGEFIHCSSSKGVCVTPIDAPYYVSRLICYGRIPQLSTSL